MSTYILVPGMWIGAWAWRDVTNDLRAAGHDVHPLTLTGVADRSHLLGPDVDMDTHITDIMRLAGLDERALELLRTRSTPHPLASVRQPLGRRATSAVLPTTMIASPFPME